MAQMIPENGPNLATGSERAEPTVYWYLANQLSEDFTVIHSIPWLSAVAQEIDNRPVPTGEIDFLILHPALGLLAVEVKGDRLGHDRSGFFYIRTKQRVDPVRQVRRGTHGLARWLKEQGGLGIKIGYVIIFPESEVGDRALPPSLFDPTVSPARKIVLDIRDLRNLGDRIQEVMKYWQKNLDTQPLGRKRVREFVDLICPVADYTPTWQTRIENDVRTWLQFYPGTKQVLRDVVEKNKCSGNRMARHR